MLGIIIKNLANSQINYELFNQLNEKHEKLKAFVVYKNLTKSFFPIKFPIINYTKIFSGYLDESTLLVATDLDSALMLSNVKNRARKIFYVWELEFLKSKDYNLNHSIYNSLPVYTRSKSYKDALDNYANIDSTIFEFNMEKLWTTNIS